MTDGEQIDQEVLQRLETVAQPVSEQVPFWERANIRPKDLAALQRELREKTARLEELEPRLLWYQDEVHQSTCFMNDVEVEISDLSQRIQLATEAVEEREKQHQRLIEEALVEIQQRDDLVKSIREDLLKLLNGCEGFGGYAKTVLLMNTPEWLIDYRARFIQFEHLVDDLVVTYKGVRR